MTKLETLATTALNKHGGNVDKALPQFASAVKAAKLIDDLARAFLRSVAAREQGQNTGDLQTARAEPTPATGSIKVRHHDVRQHRRRTSEEKAAAERAMMANVEAVFQLEIDGRPIGNIAMGELAALKRDLIVDATHKLMLGAEQVRNAVLAELIEMHAVVPDQLMRVRDVLDADTLAHLVKQAEHETPRRIEEAMRRAAEAMDHKELAA
jgi:hypothetical protein